MLLYYFWNLISIASIFYYIRISEYIDGSLQVFINAADLKYNLVTISMSSPILKHQVLTDWQETFNSGTSQ